MKNICKRKKRDRQTDRQTVSWLLNYSFRSFGLWENRKIML